MVIKTTKGPLVIEEGIWVELGNRIECDISLKMVETMCNIKEDLEIIKANNKKLLKAKEEQEEINEILLNFLTNNHISFIIVLPHRICMM